MKITKIDIRNFKSFEDISAELNDFNVIVGASASGKSNFIEAFRFLKDVCEDFEKGINNHGGHFFKNINLDSSNSSCIKVRFSDGEAFSNRTTSDNYLIQYTSIDYELCINFDDTINETVKFDFNLFKDDVFIKNNSLILNNQNWKISANLVDNDVIDLEELVPKALLNIVNDNMCEKHELIINSPLASVPISWRNYFKSISYYNFDPKVCRVDNGSGNVVLNESGQNLPVVLEKILEDSKKHGKFLNLVSILLAYIEDISVFKLEDNRRMFRVSEKYNHSPVLSPLLSDGCVNILALITALYFEDADIILIEEPERNIHPALFIQLVGMMKEVCLKKQIIITTHSPEILNCCNLADIHLISRDSKGFSRISKPVNNEEIKDFIKTSGIGQVFVDNYLEFGNE